MTVRYQYLQTAYIYVDDHWCLVGPGSVIDHPTGTVLHPTLATNQGAGSPIAASGSAKSVSARKL